VTTWFTSTPSPVGELLLAGDGAALSLLSLHPQRDRDDLEATAVRDDAAFAAVVAQLQAYFAGDLHEFDVPLAPEGSAFQRRVWDELRTIPYGTTISYGELARRVDRPGAARAVGLANGRNPLPIIVPCHRVIGSDGRLTGYGGGVERKRFLLELEAHHAPASAPPGLQLAFPPT
jgi:methylated-DNA-[protein]-cysteine S-methyltransferase